MKTQAIEHLRRALGDPGASFRDGQWESIEALLAGRRTLVVQRTGWGKSMVYFIATKLLCQPKRKLTLLISPLLALMRNQITAAEKLGLVTKTINSDNTEDWEGISKALKERQIDLLLISPERLANKTFIMDIFAEIAENIGLFVVDEAHCISDWGHDFRPDYRRIVRILENIPKNTPILATTATANNRVVDDIKTQLGEEVEIQRGSLVRHGLILHNINMPSPAARMAWLAKTLPLIPGSGIIYTLTQRDANRVTAWLIKNKINAAAYHAGLNEKREALETQLLNNEIKALVATVALGMGFDKPDLAFVIHYQRPGSVVHYYQQVGRAGRGINKSHGVLLCGKEDDHIIDFFIKSAFPPQQHITEILTVLQEANTGLSAKSLEESVNIRRGGIEQALQYMTIDNPSPIIKMGAQYKITPAAESYQIDKELIRGINAIRKKEQQRMQAYMRHDKCLMAFLQEELDDPNLENCGICKNCNPDAQLAESYDADLAKDAALFVKNGYLPIEPRKQWPQSNCFQKYAFGKMKISEELRASEGRALCLWRDAGWGELVYKGKYEKHKFSDELVSACVDMLKNWRPTPAPRWVACIPSTTSGDLISDFAERLAKKLKLPFIPCIDKVRDTQPQKDMENSYQKARNLDGAFRLKADLVKNTPCLLIDDVVDSRWTLTIAAALLRQQGGGAVYPLALALNSP